jgi:LPS export ABC transporter protein LptC
MRPADQRARRLTTGLVAALAFAAGGVLAWRLLADRTPDIEARTARDQRGYYLTEATLTEMGVDGAPRIVLHAAQVEQQLSDQSVLLTDLSVDYNAAQAGTWKLTADRGRLLSDATSLQLSGNVVVKGAEARGEAVILTDNLTYETRTGIVQTAEPVALSFGPHRLEGRGLRVALNEGRLRLESNVHGRFNP